MSDQVTLSDYDLHLPNPLQLIINPSSFHPRLWGHSFRKFLVWISAGTSDFLIFLCPYTSKLRYSGIWQCNMMYGFEHFGGIYTFHFQMKVSIFLPNVGTHIADYTASPPRKPVLYTMGKYISLTFHYLQSLCHLYLEAGRKTRKAKSCSR
jgi:hypothetical protein